MEHLILKFNHGVEIGARLAYLGHYRATKNLKIKDIADDEFCHKQMVESILLKLGSRPSRIIDGVFGLIGNVIYWLCQIHPEPVLDFVAMCLEMFAVFSYTKCAELYPEYAGQFKEMAEKEKEHERYFKGA